MDSGRRFLLEIEDALGCIEQIDKQEQFEELDYERSLGEQDDDLDNTDGGQNNN